MTLKSVTNRESIGDAFKQWVDTDSTFIDVLPDGTEYPLYILVGQGAGSRAAYWMGQSVNISELFPFLSASASVDGFNYVDGGLYEN